MFTWPQIILLVLQIADKLIDTAQQNKWMKAGADAEIAKVSAAILRKTQAGKELWEKIDAMDANAVDAGLRGLEPK